MPTELVVHAVNRDHMRIVADAGPHTVSMDYPLQPGQETDGLTPLQLLLASLAGCSGNTLASLLRKREQTVGDIEVIARGLRRDEHPTVITDIALEFVIHGEVEPAVVERALALSEDRLCPVWAMLKGGTRITLAYRVVA
jgi:putative redox protein